MLAPFDLSTRPGSDMGPVPNYSVVRQGISNFFLIGGTGRMFANRIIVLDTLVQVQTSP
jgi:hypothetical protein